MDFMRRCRLGFQVAFRSRLNTRDKRVVDRAMTDIAANPAIGEEKKGDLAEVLVFKFKVN